MDAAEITELFGRFEPDGNQAQPTSRLLNTEYAQENLQEWVEYGTIDGKPVSVYYMFTNEEASVEDGGDMPWDADHVSGIQFDEE